MYKRNIIIAILILAAGIAVYHKLASMKKAPARKKGEMLRSLIVQPLKREEVIPIVRGYAPVRSSETVELRCQVSGKVVYKNEATTNGSCIQAGDVLIKIEPDDYIITRDLVAAELEVLKAEKAELTQNKQDLEKMLSVMKNDYELEMKNYERIKQLYERNVISLSEKEKAHQLLARRHKLYIETSNHCSSVIFDLQKNAAKTKKSEVTLRQAELNLKRCTIKAPICGRVTGCNIEKGEYLNAGQAVCTLKNDALPELSVPLNAKDISRVLGIVPDQTKWFKIPEKMKVVLSWDDNPEKCAWNAKITRIEKYESKTDTVNLLVVPTTYAGKGKKAFPLLPGMFCRIDFYGAPRQGFKIPFSALQLGNKVYTVNKNGILHAYKVKPFHIEGDDVIILSDLPNGAKVVIQQLPRGLLDGMKVKAATR